MPGRPEQFEPRVEGDRLIGRGAYDMKGGLAAMMCALHDLADAGRASACGFVCVPDEESEEIDERSTDALVGAGLRRRLRHHRRADRPAHRRPGQGRAGDADRGRTARAAHGSTPWLGDNAVLKAIDVFRANRVAALHAASPRSCSTGPRSTSGRIAGGDALNKVPDAATMAVDVRYLPGQDPGEILAQIRAIPDVDVTRTFIRPPANVSRSNPYVRGAARGRVAGAPAASR